MTEYNKVGIVCPPPAKPFFEPILDGLAEAKCAYREFGTLDGLIAESDFASHCRVLVAPGGLPVGEPVFDALPNLRGLVSPFIGIEGFDLEAATRRGVIVANGNTSQNVESMAEATILLTLAALYDLDDARDQLRSGWRGTGGMRSRMLKGRTVGLIGYGAIAQAVAARLASWGVSLLVSTPRLKVALPAGSERLDLQTLLARSDIVLVLCSLNDETRGMIGRAKLEAMKEDAVLVVTSRGGIVDEDALAEMLECRPGFRASLDVFATEPLPKDSPLRKLPSAILTPHGIGHTEESIGAIAPMAIASVLALAAGKTPRGVCNPAALDRWSSE